MVDVAWAAEPATPGARTCEIRCPPPNLHTLAELRSSFISLACRVTNLSSSVGISTSAVSYEDVLRRLTAELDESPMTACVLLGDECAC